MSEHLRAAWRAIAAAKTASPARGIGFEDLWRSQEPLIQIVGKLPSQAGNFGDWEGYMILAHNKMTYQAALRPADFVRALLADAKRSDAFHTYYPTSLHLIAMGRGREGNEVAWHVGQMPPDGHDWAQPRDTLQGRYRAAEPNPRLLHALTYTSGEEARKWIGENLAGVVTDDSMFDQVREGKWVTIYRGISVPKGVDPSTSNKSDNEGTGSSWTVSLDTAKAIAERGRAGFSGTQTLGDTYRLIRDETERIPSVIRAEVVIEAPEEGRAAPYRPWTIDYGTEAEIDLPHGMKFEINGVLQATKVVRSKGVENWMDPPEPKYDRPWEEVTWRWGNSWRTVHVTRTAGLEEEYEHDAETAVQRAKLHMTRRELKSAYDHAKARGDLAEMRQLKADLVALDARLDAL